ncbi:MAG: esterase-like activity of phytase family protein [Novosphingobium sp.]
MRQLLPRRSRRLRFALGLLAAIGLSPGTWIRTVPPPPDTAAGLTVKPVKVAPLCCHTGPFHLVGAWQLTSRHPGFGGYSALVEPAPGRLMALSDRGYFVEFSRPGGPPGPVRFDPLFDDAVRLKNDRDVEAASRDPRSGRLWLAQEGRNAIERKAPDMTREVLREIPEMQGWPHNTGPEAMVRLSDGRFLVLCECSTTRWTSSGIHQALLFQTDPTDQRATARPFTFIGVKHYRPTAMAELPDGQVLILARRLTWPMPPRFAIKILIADPGQIAPGGTWHTRELADLQPPWPIENYEGLVIRRQGDGRLVAWMISDENGAATQRVVLLELEIDEKRLPPKQKAPG